MLSWLPAPTLAQDGSAENTDQSSSPAATDENQPTWLVSIATDKRILEVPFDTTNPEKSTTTITATVTDSTTSEPVVGIKVFFTSGNVYFPDTTGQVVETDKSATTDDKGEARSSYVTSSSPFEDIVDLYATTFIDQDNLNYPVYSHPYQIVNNNPDITSSPAIESVVTAEQQFENQPPTTGGEQRTTADLMNEVKSSGQDGMRVEMDAQLGASDNHQADQWVGIKVDVRGAATKAVSSGSQNPPDLGLTRLVFSGTASDGSNNAASFKSTALPAMLAWTQSQSGTSSTTEGDSTQAKTWGTDKSFTNVLDLNPRAWGQRHLTITVQLISKGSSTPQLLSAAGAQPGNQGEYILAEKTLDFQQDNPDQPQLSVTAKADPETIDSQTKNVKLNGQVLLDDQPNVGRIKVSLTGSDGVTGKFNDANTNDLVTDPNGNFSLSYAPEQDGKSRDITITIDAVAADEVNKTPITDIDQTSGSLVIHQTGSDQKESPTTPDSARVLLDKVTDGVRTLSVYGQRKSAAFGAVQPYRTKTLSTPGGFLGGGGLFSPPFFTKVDMPAGMISSGTRIVDLLAQHIDPANYVPLFVEITENATGAPAATSSINGKVERTPNNVRGDTHLLAAEGVQEDFFFGGYSIDTGNRSKQADLTTVLDNRGQAAYYYAPGIPDDWAAVRARSQDPTKPADTVKVVFSHSYLNPATAQPTDLTLTLNIDVFADKSSISDVDKGNIEVTPVEPLAWTTNEDSTFGGFASSYEDLLNKYHSGDISPELKQYLEDQIAWTINVQVQPPKDAKDWQMPKQVALRSNPKGDFIKATKASDGSLNFTGQTQPGGDSNPPGFTPEPLIATPPDQFSQLKDVTGWFTLDLDNGKGAAAFIPAQSPREAPTTIYAFYADPKTGAVETSKVIDERQPEQPETPEAPKPGEQKPQEMLTKEGVRIKFSAQKYEVKTDGRDSTILDMYIDPTIGSESGIIPKDLNPMLFLLGWSGPRGDTKVLSQDGIIGGLVEARDKLAMMAGFGDPNYLWQVPNNEPSELHIQIFYSQDAMLAREWAKGVKLEDPSSYFIRIYYDYVDKPELVEGGTGKKRISTNHKTEAVTIKKVAVPEAGAGSAASHYSATLQVAPTVVPIDKTATATVGVTIKTDPATGKPYEVSTDPIQVDFTIDGVAVFDNGKKQYTYTIPAKQATGNAVATIKAENADAYQKTATITAKYRIEPTGEAKTEGTAIGTPLVIKFGAASNQSQSEQGGNNNQGDNGGSSNPPGGWFDPNKPLLPLNINQSLDKLNGIVRNSSYISQDRRGRINDYINQLKQNPPNWNSLMSKISSELNQATLNHRSDPATKQLWKELGDAWLDLVNNAYRSDSQKSEADKRELDQAIDYAKNGSYDPLILLRRRVNLDYYPGFGAAMGAYGGAGIDMLNPSQDYSNSSGSSSSGGNQSGGSSGEAGSSLTPSAIGQQISALWQEFTRGISGALAGEGEQQTSAPRINIWKIIWSKLISLFK
jgi:hypothetical protein